MKTIFCIAMISALTLPLMGQSDNSGTEGRGWLQGAPRDRCSHFMLLESAYFQRVAETDVRDDKDGFLIDAGFSYMYNISARTALGLKLSVGGDDDVGFYALTPRFRYWYTDKLYGEAMVGMKYIFDSNYRDISNPAFTSSISIGYSDLVSVIARYDIEKFEYYDLDGEGPDELIKGTQKSFYIGAQTGSYLALVIPVAIIIAYGIDPD